MGVRNMVVATPCPACGQQRLVYTAADLDVPYFGPILETIIICGACGFKHGDVVIGRTHEPTRITISIQQESDMMVRVVRSTSGTVRIPELGARIDPGPSSEAFVSNVEGVLVRIERILGQLLRDAGNEKQRKAIQERMADFAATKAGTRPATLILEDPYGNCAIGSPKAHSEIVDTAEAESWARGEYTFDVSDLEEPSGSGNGAGPA